MARKSAFARIATDVIALIAVGLPCILIYQLVTPYQRGLFCNDNSIRYPRKDDTISGTVVIIVGYILPLILITTAEIVRYKWGSDKHMYIAKHFHPLFVNCYQNAIAFVLGAMFTSLVTVVGKLTIGRLRPHFWDVCSPINISCYDYRTLYDYHTDFTCEKTDQDLITNARMSFPSGHTSAAWFSMTYFSIYIWKKVLRNWSLLMRPLCVFLLLLAAFYCSLSRVMDNAHHPTDVIAGAIIGTVIAIITALILPNLIRHRIKDETIPLVTTSNEFTPQTPAL